MMDTPETQVTTDPKAAISVQAMLRRASVTRARHKLAGLEKSGDQAARDQFLASWRGHAQWADCRNLLTHLGVLR